MPPTIFLSGSAGEPAVDLNDRDSLIAWHEWNDPNGVYSDADIDIEGSGLGYWTLENLRSLALTGEVGVVILRPIVKTYGWTLRARGYMAGTPMRRECWSAETTDGEWAFVRIEDTGTPWEVVHWPNTPQAETAAEWFGTLKAARESVERGIDRWLPSVQRATHERGEHTTDDPYGCRLCSEARWVSKRLRRAR